MKKIVLGMFFVGFITTNLLADNEIAFNEYLEAKDALNKAEVYQDKVCNKEFDLMSFRDSYIKCNKAKIETMKKEVEFFERIIK